jgi:hypothetical protein
MYPTGDHTAAPLPKKLHTKRADPHKNGTGYFTDAFL